MLPAEIPLTVLGVLYIILPIFLLTQKRNKQIYTFCLTLIGMSGMIVDNILFPYAPNFSAAYILGVVGYNAGAYTSYVFLLFCQHYIKYERILPNLLNSLLKYLHILTQLLLIVPYLVIKDIHYKDGNPQGLITTPLVLIFISCIILNIISAFYVIIVKYSKSKSIEKLKLQLFFIGFSFLICAFIISNFLLPVVFKVFDYLWIGPLSTSLLIAITTFSILKLQLFDIRVLLGRIVYYFLIATVFISTYYAIYFSDQKFFGGSANYGAFIEGILFSILFAVSFVKFNDYLRTQVRSRIINPGYDPLEVTDKLSRKLAKMLSLKDISNTTLSIFPNTIKPDFASIIIYTDKSNNDKFQGTKSVIYSTIENDNRFTPLLLQTIEEILPTIGNYPVIFDQILEESNQKQYPDRFRGKFKQIIELMTVLNIKVLVPLRENESNSGVLLIGSKEGNAYYMPQDVQFLQGVSSTVGLAITRSLYFLEVEDLNINLQKRVDVATADLKTKNAELTDAMTKLQEIRRRERDMVDVMGHELRTPITIVRNALLFLQSQLESGGEITKEKLIEYVDKAVESSRREISLVETLLSATKIDANRIQLNLTKIDMLDVINDSLEALKETASEKALKIRYEKPAQEYWGFADRNRTQEIMDNFLSNAIKYTQKGFVEITVGQTDKEAFISVKDSGIGIHKTDLENLGKKFYRAKQYTDSKGDTNIVRPGGTGLGLYVSFNLIKMMGGRVQIQSEPGQGSTFTMLLPLYTGQEDRHVDQTFD